MKIGQGNPAGGVNTSLIEQMQKAHAERLEETQKSGGSSSTFSMGEVEAAQPSDATSSLPSLDRKVVGIAERVLKGDLKDAIGARKEVLHAIVDTRYGDMIPTHKRRQTVQLLEQNMLDDPAFSKEVDHMLILAARQVATP